MLPQASGQQRLLSSVQDADKQLLQGTSSLKGLEPASAPAPPVETLHTVLRSAKRFIKRVPELRQGLTPERIIKTAQWALCAVTSYAFVLGDQKILVCCWHHQSQSLPCMACDHIVVTQHLTTALCNGFCKHVLLDTRQGCLLPNVSAGCRLWYQCGTFSIT